MPSVYGEFKDCMHIAFCGPVSLRLLKNYVRYGEQLPEGYQYPFIAFLTKELVRKGHAVSIVTHTTDVDQLVSFVGPSVKLVIVPLRKRARNYIADFYRKEVAMMSEQLQKLKPDVVHAQWTYEFADAAIASGLPTLVTARDSPFRIAWITKSAFRLLRALYSTFYVLPRTHNLSANSEYLAGEVRRFHGYFRKIVVVPNGIDNSRFAEKKSFGMRSDGGATFVCVSEWDKRKNLPVLLRAFPLICKSRPECRLILFGRGLEIGGPAFQWAVRHGLAAGVDFKGYKSQCEILNCLRDKADLFISPSVEESLGMIFVEAMAQGVACIGGRSSGAVPWVLGNGGAGLLVDVSNHARMADEIVGLLGTPDRVAELARSGYQRARQEFQLEKVASDFVRMYREVIDEASR